MPSESPRPYHHGDLRQTLLDLGLQVLAEDGAQALSLRRVARLAGVSHNAPYTHFADRDALIAAIADEGFTALTARMHAALDGVPPGHPDALRRLAEAYVAFALDSPHRLAAMFPVAGAPPSTPGPAAAQGFTLLVDTIRAGQHAGHLRPGDPHLSAAAMWALLHGLATLLIAQRLSQATPPGHAPANLTRPLLELLLGGLQAGPSA